tara:strand:- start:391 stop:690 length:300 start_codon:yes stop_codon:yes gene_type:complete
MFSLYKIVFGFCLPINGRDHFRKKVDVQISCWENIIQCSNLSWKERVNAYEKLGELFEYKHVLDNVKDAKVNILPEDLEHVNTNDVETDESYSWFDFDH